MAASAEEIERVYRARYESFGRAAAAVAGDWSSGHDAVQEGFARALRRRATFTGGPLEPWLWRIVVRSALDARRAAAAGGPVVTAADDPAPVVDASVRDAVRGLSQRQRLMVFLRFYADLSYSEIAAVCEVRIGTVSATLAQACAAMRRELEEQRP